MCENLAHFGRNIAAISLNYFMQKSFLSNETYMVIRPKDKFSPHKLYKGFVIRKTDCFVRTTKEQMWMQRLCCRDVPDNGYGKQNNKKLR